MFGVRIIVFACTLLGLTAFLPVASAEARSTYSATGSHGAGARPSRWCGWWMRTQKGGGPELNLARNWTHWGRPTPPQVGAVVVCASCGHDHRAERPRPMDREIRQ